MVQNGSRFLLFLLVTLTKSRGTSKAGSFHTHFLQVLLSKHIFQVFTSKINYCLNCNYSLTCWNVNLIPPMCTCNGKSLENAAVMSFLYSLALCCIHFVNYFGPMVCVISIVLSIYLWCGCDVLNHTYCVILTCWCFSSVVFFVQDNYVHKPRTSMFVKAVINRWCQKEITLKMTFKAHVVIVLGR